MSASTLVKMPHCWESHVAAHLIDITDALLLQRYWMNETFFKPGGPIFLMLGGAGEADPMWMVEGAWVEYAKGYNAMLVMLEHRFYGYSQPLL